MSDRNGYIRTIYGTHTHTDDDDNDDDDDDDNDNDNDDNDDDENDDDDDDNDDDDDTLIFYSIEMTLLIKASFSIGGRINNFESKDNLLNNQKSQLMKSSTYVIISFNSLPFLDPFNMATCETSNPIVFFS